ncbi:hypothetical protein, partial [Pusillimonas noertemannii]|uniref:hypothetical protein n=1 Tax=Pusillimonas noertemannii TaxID=305977 RepID=UPI001AD8BB90
IQGWFRRARRNGLPRRNSVIIRMMSGAATGIPNPQPGSGSGFGGADVPRRFLNFLNTGIGKTP